MCQYLFFDHCSPKSFIILMQLIRLSVAADPLLSFSRSLLGLTWNRYWQLHNYIDPVSISVNIIARHVSPHFLTALQNNGRTQRDLISQGILDSLTLISQRKGMNNSRIAEKIILLLYICINKKRKECRFTVVTDFSFYRLSSQ